MDAPGLENALTRAAARGVRCFVVGGTSEISAWTELTDRTPGFIAGVQPESTPHSIFLTVDGEAGATIDQVCIKSAGRDAVIEIAAEITPEIAAEWHDLIGGSRCAHPTENEREMFVAFSLTQVDLRQIVALSMQTADPLPPEKLLNLYRYGDQRSPWEELESERLRHVEDTLQSRVIGQDESVHQSATMIVKARMGLSGLQHSRKPGKPKGALFFVGPSGVGKTELAKAMAEFLFGDDTACIRFDMSEYSQEHSDQRLVGAPPGYVGFEEGGQLTNAVRERPFCVLLFDEIEKAHGRILDKFLQILEDGRLTDGRGETTHFSECVIIFTSNIGARDAPKNGDVVQTRLHFQTAVENHFVTELNRPELLNRLGENVVVFNRIVDDGFRRAIIAKQITPLRLHLSENLGVGLHLTESVTDGFLASARADHGGRGLGNVIERDLLNPLAWYLFEHEHQLRKGRVLNVDRDSDQLTFDLREESR